MTYEINAICLPMPVAIHQNGNFLFSGFQKRKCDISLKHFGERNVKGKKIKIYETHNTADCKMKFESSNKEGNESYFDTCACTHFVKEIPRMLTKVNTGTVRGSKFLGLG